MWLGRFWRGKIGVVMQEEEEEEVEIMEGEGKRVPRCQYSGYSAALSVKSKISVL